MKKSYTVIFLSIFIILIGMNQVKALTQGLTANKIDQFKDSKSGVFTTLIERAPTIKSLAIETTVADIDYTKVAAAGGETILFNQLNFSDTITVKYEYVGTYKGENISAILTISSIVGEIAMDGGLPRYGFTEPSFTFYNSLYNGITIKNVREFDVDFKFYTGINFTNELNFSEIGEEAYLTFLSLNVNECVVNEDITTPTILTEDTLIADTVNTYTSKNMWCGTSDLFIDELGEETYTNAAISFKLKGTSSKFTLAALNSNYGTFLLNNAPVFGVLQDNPVKQIYNMNNEKMDMKDLVAGTEYYYTITQTMNILGQEILAKYQSLTIIDILPNNITVSSMDLLDEFGNVIDNPGNIINQTGKVTYTMCDELLENSPYLGEKYILKIVFKVKDAVADCTEFKNEATTTINIATPTKSNIVTNYVNCPNKLPQTGANDYMLYIGISLAGLGIIAATYLRSSKYKKSSQ